jgi:hypothetical protein
MKKILLVLLLVCLIRAEWTRAQSPIPIDVFAEHNRSEESLTLYFTNPISGLSTPVEIQGFAPNLLAIEELTLTPNGVLFKNPADRQVLLGTPDGRIIPHPFIPQQSQGLVTVDWVLSPDQQSIAWVEVFPAADRWISNAYLADIDGTTITPLPLVPVSPTNPLGRMLPLAITNDRSLLFYDAAFPVEARTLTDYFPDYQDIGVYVVNRGAYERLPGEPVCPCGAGIGGGGRIFLRLSLRNPGFNLTWWNLDSNTSQPIPFERPAFAQAGDFLVPESEPIAFYTQAENLETTDVNAPFALMMVNFTTRSQRVLLGSSPQRFRVMAVIDSGNVILMVDVYGGGTYKLNLVDGTLTLVSENTWLGTIWQP